jgi:hypothetical protein
VVSGGRGFDQPSMNLGGSIFVLPPVASLRKTPEPKVTGSSPVGRAIGWTCGRPLSRLSGLVVAVHTIIRARSRIAVAHRLNVASEISRSSGATFSRPCSSPAARPES